MAVDPEVMSDENTIPTTMTLPLLPSYFNGMSSDVFGIIMSYFYIDDIIMLGITNHSMCQWIHHYLSLCHTICIPSSSSSSPSPLGCVPVVIRPNGLHTVVQYTRSLRHLHVSSMWLNITDDVNNKEPIVVDIFPEVVDIILQIIDKNRGTFRHLSGMCGGISKRMGMTLANCPYLTHLPSFGYASEWDLFGLLTICQQLHHLQHVHIVSEAHAHVVLPGNTLAQFCSPLLHILSICPNGS
jgi:hypothetical protein